MYQCAKCLGARSCAVCNDKYELSVQGSDYTGWSFIQDGPSPNIYAVSLTTLLQAGYDERSVQRARVTRCILKQESAKKEEPTDCSLSNAYYSYDEGRCKDCDLAQCKKCVGPNSCFECTDYYELEQDGEQNGGWMVEKSSSMTTDVYAETFNTLLSAGYHENEIKKVYERKC